MRVDLKKFRKEHEMKQDAIVKVLGVTQSTVSRIETEGLELTNNQYNRLISHYGEVIKQYVITSETTCSSIPNDSVKNPSKGAEQLPLYNLLTIIQNQQELLNKCVEMQHEYIAKYATQNDRLLSILEQIKVN